MKTAETSAATATVASLDAALRVSGPYAAENLEVFLCHLSSGDDPDFLTLDEGLRDGSVVVTEKPNATVAELEIENTSCRPLFIQEGDRLQGGRQDRTVHTSLVVPAKSGRGTLPAFCVEQSRWREGKAGSRFAACGSGAFASKTVRVASKIAADQTTVWRAVAAEKQALTATVAAPCRTSSLNETVDSREVQAGADAYVAALKGVLASEKAAVGVAFVVNGKVEEVDLYPGPTLLAKLYPRLLASYAVQALAQKRAGAASPPTAPGAVLSFLGEGGARSQKTERVNAANTCGVVEFDGRVECRTDYEGRRVHWQAIGR
jgi:hypothetical protein